MDKLSKEDLIRALETAEKSSGDLGGRVGEIGIMGLTGAGTAAVTSTALTTVVTTASTATAPVLGSTFLGGLLGATVTTTSTAVVAAPLLPVIGAAALGVFLSKGIITLVKSGWNNDFKREKYIAELRKKVAAYDTVPSVAGNPAAQLAKLAGIYATLLKLDVIESDKVQSVFKGIENGSVSADYALTNAKKLADSLLLASKK
ncbi:hypothetical protein [Thiocapsa imhoffii]|uniref:hypothetical protein n=1 Tax=Thiocapsa imhoffii TaxID=382777 RepID=UPI001904B58C|nr:hypothetical protein [Thiocapsa imhoffii]